jgi:hypothetical protein
MPITRVEQLEQALGHAREMIADLRRWHEAAEQAWAKNELRQAQEIEQLRRQVSFLESCLTADVVTRTKEGTRYRFKGHS